MHRGQGLESETNRGATVALGTEEVGLVSGRFLSDFFKSLEQHGVPATQLLGDLPIPLDERGHVTSAVDWVDFVEFMKRLEHHTDGVEGLEACGENVCELRPISMLRGLVGLSASPYSLYRAASQWALRRAIPAIETHIEEVEHNRIEIRVRLAEGLRPCPQLFHVATGGARALPRILQLNDAVVTAHVDEFEALYQITVPPSRTLWARVTRFFRTIISAGSVLEFLEAQQLELHAKHLELQQAKTALAESERRHRTLTDAAVDVLCELDEQGHIVYVSASVKDLMGYTPEQVTGSHFSLWVSGDHRDEARTRFGSIAMQSPTQPVTRQRVRLHTESGSFIIAELSLRSYRTPEGELRMVAILRDETDRPTRKPPASKHAHPSSPIESVRALSAKIEELRAADQNHPLAHSLTILLSSLDDHAEGVDDFAVDEIVSATQRMTQIVESAMANAQDSTAHFRWHETTKFCERICSEFTANAPRMGASIKIERERAPSLFWADERLLTVGLRSLFEWTTEQALFGAEILLRVEPAEAGSERPGGIMFSLVESAPEDRGEPSDQALDRDATLAARLNLALATAKDAVSALGGDLRLERVGPGPALRCQLRLRQPKSPQS